MSGNGSKSTMDHLIGKSIIACITFRGRKGELVEYFQTHGHIVDASEEVGILIEKSDKSGLFGWPPNMDWLKQARPGTYRLRGTGQEIVNPDFLGNVILADVLPENLEQYKSHGFSNFGPRD